MYQFFVPPSAIEGKRVHITGADVNHIRNVLRMKVGEELSVSNGCDGKEYRCGILELGEDEILCELRFIKEDSVELPCPVTLYQGLPKADKMELILQKAVELGAVRIVPVAMKRCVVKLDPKKAESKRTRWQTICEAAAKQSKRAIVPEVSALMPFAEALKEAASADVPLVPYEMAEDISYTRQVIRQIKPGQSISVMIGPEGGFDEEEIRQAEEAGMKKITLGKRILRTETAGMTMLSILMYELEASGEKE
ncbi:MAG: 16S rRNA (uracil(1498)-N(3))-methyltransferase [Lachnospiraceae bacterium]|nr:16S rRNA (uracil(1498)-N(3))-methyltransferase [Lachnospiraceae bacterium]